MRGWKEAKKIKISSVNEFKTKQKRKEKKNSLKEIIGGIKMLVIGVSERNNVWKWETETNGRNADYMYNFYHDLLKFFFLSFRCWIDSCRYWPRWKIIGLISGMNCKLLHTQYYFRNEMDVGWKQRCMNIFERKLLSDFACG